MMVGLMFVLLAAGEPVGFTLNFDADPPGAPAAGVEAVVGDWSVSKHGDAVGLLVDGSRWRNGTPSASIADQAKRLYGDRYAEFLDGVKAFAYFPLAVVDREPPPGDLKLSVRFLPLAGRIDQGAGIAFDIKPDGSYLGVRANALENNLLFFNVVKGKRTIVQNVRGTETASKVWHMLAATITGLELHVDLDGKRVLERKLDGPVAGKVGLWSKADSQVLFDDFVVGKP